MRPKNSAVASEVGELPTADGQRVVVAVYRLGADDEIARDARSCGGIVTGFFAHDDRRKLIQANVAAAFWQRAQLS